MVDEPSHVALHLFLSCTGHLTELSAVDVALGIVVLGCGIGSERSRQIELQVLAARHRDRIVVGRLRTCHVCSVAELLEPRIAAQVDVACLVGISLVARHYLLVNSTKKDKRFHLSRSFLGLPTPLIFKLPHVHQAGVCHLKPSLRLEDTDETDAGVAGLLCHHV